MIVGWVTFPFNELASENPSIDLRLKDMLLEDGRWNVNLLSSYLRQNNLQAVTQTNFSLSILTQTN